MGRAAQGVRILSIDKPDFVIGVDRVVKEEESEKEGEAQAGKESAETDGGSET